MAETYLQIRVREGCALPATPSNGRPGQWQHDSNWYPVAGKDGKPRQLGRSWETVPAGAAQAAMNFFTQDGTCLVEIQAYEGPITPQEAQASKLTWDDPATGERHTFDSVPELVAFVQSQGDGRKGQKSDAAAVQARKDELAKLDRPALLDAVKASPITVGPNSSDDTIRAALLKVDFPNT